MAARKFFLLLLPFFLVLPIINCNAEVEKRNFTAFSIILDIQNDAEWENFTSYIIDLDFRNFTFVVGFYPDYVYEYILPNSTRIEFLQEYGEIIPAIGYAQTKTPEARENDVDYIFGLWHNYTGTYPQGIFCFQPDTHQIFYAKSAYNITYVQGYCFDQYAIDYMTMRGGWQMPYYANESHVLVPNEHAGIVVLPHVTWDWVASFTRDHSYTTHIASVYVKLNYDINATYAYITQLIDRTLEGATPFGYVNVQMEYVWGTMNMSDTIKSIYANILQYCQSKNYRTWRYSDIVNWLIETYPAQPAYRVNFESPLTGEKIEWYWDIKIRVARIDNKVVSYIYYREQNSDPYLNGTASIDFKLPHYLPENCIDYSLSFAVDALGGAPNRAPAATKSVYYTGDLANFDSYYDARNAYQELIRAFIPVIITIAMLSLAYRLLQDN